MTITIREKAEALATEFRGLGRDVTIAHSTNRNGDFSSYLTVSGVSRRFRVSDHFSGWTDAMDVWGSAAKMLADLDRAAIDAEAERVSEAAQLAERDAPFRARFLAAKQHEQHAIVCEAYPAAAHDKAFKRQIVARWTKEG